MAIDLLSGKISNEQATIESFLLPSLLRDMEHGQDGYVERDALGASLQERTVNTKKLWINGYVTVYAESDLHETFDREEGMIELMRVIRLKAPNARGGAINGYCVDDSNSRLSEDSHPDERVRYFHPQDEIVKPMRVIAYASNVLSAASMQEALQRQFALELGRNALLEFSKRV